VGHTVYSPFQWLVESITWIFRIIFGILSNIPRCIYFS